jgi:hypothetical protein
LSFGIFWGMVLEGYGRKLFFCVSNLGTVHCCVPILPSKLTCVKMKFSDLKGTFWLFN